MKVFAFVSEGQEEEKNMLENIQSIIEHAGSTGNLLMTHGFEPVTEAFGIRFYPARSKVIMDGIQYTLTRAQFHLLHLLAAYEGQLVSHSEIIQIITKERNGKPATLTESSNYMRNLRKKLCLDSETSRYILKSVKRRGYLLIDRQEMN